MSMKEHNVLVYRKPEYPAAFSFLLILCAEAENHALRFSTQYMYMGVERRRAWYGLKDSAIKKTKGNLLMANVLVFPSKSPRIHTFT